MRIKRWATPAALVGGLFFVSPAAADTDRATFSVSGVVRTICRLQFQQSAITPSNGVVELGQFSELCNSRDGYRVILQHPQGLTGAVVEIDGFEVPLSTGTETVIRESDQPAYRISEARLRLADNAAMPSLGFRIEPKGATY